MPNNCYFSMEVKGEPKNIKKFLELFIYDEDIGNKNKEYLARTFLESYKNSKEFIKEHLEKINKGFCNINGWCAWSCYSCWIKGYPNGKELITISDACKKYKINVNVESEESGIGFEEEITCDENGYLTDECFDFVDWKCKKCNSIQNYPRNYQEEDLNYEECWECEEYNGWIENE